MQRCALCHRTEPGRRGFTEVYGIAYHSFLHDCRTYPLVFIFRAARFTECEGMNWLQDRGLIADEAIEVFEVAKADEIRVLELAKSRFNPAWIERIAA